MSIGRFVFPLLCTLCSHLPLQGMIQVCFYTQIQGGSYVELQLKGFKAWGGVGQSLYSLGWKQSLWGLRREGDRLSWAGARALTGWYRFNWAFVCQQPTVALLSWAWVPRTRSAGQDKGPTGREKPT